MYGFKEKQKHLKELHNPEAAEADLKLLQAADPAHPKLKMFGRNPLRYAGDILYTLLDYKSKNEIRLSRREFEKTKEENGTELIPDAGIGRTAGEHTEGDNKGNEGESGKALDSVQQHSSDSAATECADNGINTNPDSVIQKIIDIAEHKTEQPESDAINESGKKPVESGTEVLDIQTELERLENEKREANERAKQAQEQTGILEQEKQELAEELEIQQDAATQAEERAEQAERALEEEKKKEKLKNEAPKSKSTKSTPRSTGKTSKTKMSK